MEGQENVPLINNVNLISLLGLGTTPYTVILGKPPKGSKSVRKKTFGKRIQKTNTNGEKTQ